MLFSCGMFFGATSAFLECMLLRERVHSNVRVGTFEVQEEIQLLIFKVVRSGCAVLQGEFFKLFIVQKGLLSLERSCRVAHCSHRKGMEQRL